MSGNTTRSKNRSTLLAPRHTKQSALHRSSRTPVRAQARKRNSMHATLVSAASSVRMKFTVSIAQSPASQRKGVGKRADLAVAQPVDYAYQRYRPLAIDLFQRTHVRCERLV